MRVRVTPTIAVLGLTASIALTGCSGRTWNWKFWQSESPTDQQPAVASTAPAESEAKSAIPVAPPPTVSHTPSAPPVPAPTPAPNGLVSRADFSDVHFAAGQLTVRRADVRSLDAVVRWLKENPTTRLTIEGHTDDLGSRDGNVAVGEKRAAAIMKYMVAKGIDPRRITVTSYGSDRPVCTMKTEVCRAKNRRVQFVVNQP